MNSRITPPEVAIQLPDTKVAAEVTGTITGPLVSLRPQQDYVRRKAELIHLSLRLLCLFTSITSLSLMVTAKQSATISIYGFNLPVYSKWSFSDSFEYLVGVSAAVAVHSVLQLLINSFRVLQKSPVIPSRNHAWLIFAGDQGIDKTVTKTLTLLLNFNDIQTFMLALCGWDYIPLTAIVGLCVVIFWILCMITSEYVYVAILAYALTSAGSAASGVTNLNRTGIRHSSLPNFCKPLRHFCDHVAVSVAFTFITCFLLATSAVLDIVWLSKY